MNIIIKRTGTRSRRLYVGFLFILFVSLSGISKCIAQEKHTAAANRDSIILAARDIIGQLKYCALITVDSVGVPQARTMNPFPRRRICVSGWPRTAGLRK